jgi:hypothetical protein
MKYNMPLLFGPGDGIQVCVDLGQIIKIPVKPESFNLAEELAHSLPMWDYETYGIKKFGLKGEDGSTITVGAMVPLGRELTAWEALRLVREGTVLWQDR